MGSPGTCEASAGESQEGEDPRTDRPGRTEESEAPGMAREKTGGVQGRRFELAGESLYLSPPAAPTFKPERVSCQVEERATCGAENHNQNYK